MASVTVRVYCILTALHRNSTRACDICPRTLFSFNNIQLHSLSTSYTAKALLGVTLLYGSVLYKGVFIRVIPVDETISVSYTEPLHCSQNLRCDDVVPASRRRLSKAAAPCTAAPGAGLGVSSARAGAAAGSLPRCSGLLGWRLGPEASDWLPQLRLLPGCDGN